MHPKQLYLGLVKDLRQASVSRKINRLLRVPPSLKISDALL